MTTSEIKPALTAQQWADQGFDTGIGAGMYWNADAFRIFGPEPYGPHSMVRGEWTAHAIAAACLHGHPHGFTPRHAESLRVLLVLLETLEVPTGQPMLDDLREIRDRIAALLPPTP